jgi:putative endonuclease
MYYVYILKSLKDGKYYIGSTANVADRLAYHNAGKQRSTKNRTPFQLVYQEEYELKTVALAREKQIKSYKGGNAFQKLINGTWQN